MFFHTWNASSIVPQGFVQVFPPLAPKVVLVSLIYQLHEFFDDHQDKEDNSGVYEIAKAVHKRDPNIGSVDHHEYPQKSDEQQGDQNLQVKQGKECKNRADDDDPYHHCHRNDVRL
jgi:hypothetical protein